MWLGNSFFRASIFGAPVLLAGMIFAGGVGFGQQAKTAAVPDAQVEASVLKALAGAPRLADQAITSTTVYGVVTLSGTVRDEASRDMAEDVVSRTVGVKKVIDQLAVGAGAAAPGNAAEPDQNAAEQGTNPNLQSDGTMAPAPTQAQVEQNQGASAASPANVSQAGQYPPPSQAAPQQPYPSQQPYPAQQQPAQQPQYRQPYAGPYGAAPAPVPPAYSQQPYGREPYTQQPYGLQPQRPYVAQRGGDAVVVPSGTPLRVRVNQGMDSRHTAPGTPFDGVVLTDVYAGGFIAIPRGAMIQGVVVDAHAAGQLAGHGGLALQVTSVSLGGVVYPVATTAWSQQGADKTGNTVGNTVGLGAMGALIGAVAGGGVGAAVGAGAGTIAGLGVSSASHAGEVGIPAEAILDFRTTQPIEMTTVSQDELNRLGSGAGLPQQGLRRRYYPPPPPSPYYQPGYYAPR